MLVLQACLLAAATCFAVTAVVAWQGCLEKLALEGEILEGQHLSV
jgi:hypothetical protein